MAKIAAMPINDRQLPRVAPKLTSARVRNLFKYISGLKGHKGLRPGPKQDSDVLELGRTEA